MSRLNPFHAWFFLTPYSGGGTVTSVSVATANGFAGTVANATTSPAITITTTVTGLLQGNGTTISGITNSSTVGQVLRVTGASTYAWGALDLADGDAITGTLGVANGGTGITSFAAGIATWLGSGTATDLRTAVSGTTGDAGSALVFATSPTLVTPVLGAATATSINGLTITSSTGTLTITNGKTASFSNTLTFAGTDGTTMTFPGSSDTVVTLAATQELDNKTLDSSVGKGTWTASGTWTLPAITAGGVITLAENASVALDPAGSADGKYTGITITGTAGATLAFGDLIYLDPTDSRWELADANAAAAADGDARGVLGICVLAATSDGDPTTILLHGVVRADTAFPALTINAPAYVSETAGDIVVTQPTTADVVIRVVGFALTADELFFSPSSDYITHV